MEDVYIEKINAQDLAAGEPAALQSMRKAATEIGFAVVYNTDISKQQVEKVLSTYRDFFTLPHPDKEPFNMAKTRSNRGWGAPLSEQVNDQANADYKEFFDCGFTLDEGDPLAHKLCYAPNIWPNQPAEFQAIIADYYMQALKVSHLVLKGLAHSLDKSPAVFENAFKKPMALLRGNYYPQRPKNAGDKDFGIAAHTDYGCLTLLATDGSEGLEVQTRDGQWLALQAPPGEFIINFGDMMSFWTDGLVKATPHRVIGTSKERLSIPMFMNPSDDTNVAPDGKEAVYAGPYLQKRFEETYKHLQQ